MTPACLIVGAATLLLHEPRFTLEWTHSVERTAWREAWRVEPDALVLESSAVRGSGAGMEPSPDARLEDGWWVSSPGLRVPALVLAASGATGGGWRLCADGVCRAVGVAAGPPVAVSPCDAAGSALPGVLAH